MDSAPPPGTEHWLAIFFYLVAGATSLVVLFRQIFPKPKVSEIGGQPIHVKEAKEYTSVEQHNELRDQVEKLSEKVETGFKDLTEERSRSVGNLHQRIEQADIKNQQLTGALRMEIKEDTRAVHERINLMLEGLSELKGSISTWMTRNPFGK